METEYIGRKFKTEFRNEELPDDTRISEIIEWGMRLHKAGFLPAEHGGHAGNMSFRNNKGFVITAGGVSKGSLNPRNFVQVFNCNIDTKWVEAGGQLEPSSETLTHYLIYRERPDVNSIIHVHDNLVMENAKELKIKATKREHDYGTVDLAYEIEKVLGHEKFIVVKGHGVISFGKSPWEAGKRILTIHDDAEKKIKD